MSNRYELLKDKPIIRKYRWCKVVVLVVLLIMLIMYLVNPVEEESELLKSLYTPQYTDNYTNENDSVIHIAILSRPLDIEKRNMIRETWKKRLLVNMTLSFYIGTLNLTNELNGILENEMQLHNDLILFPDLIDAYESLSIKLLKIMVHISTIPNIKWLFKTDTDVWLNPNELYALLNRKAYQMAIGYHSEVKTPVVHYAELRNDYYNNIYYPVFNVGAGYALSIDVVHYLSTQYIKKWLKLMPNEDSALGVWLSSLNVDMIHTDRINNYYSNKKWNYGHLLYCDEKDVVVHYLSPTLIKRADSNYEKCQNPCGC